MKKEYSYGAVIYRISDGKIEYLLEKMALGHISIPKGHIETGETPVETVHREIKEELNVSIDLDTSFKKTISYKPRKNVCKDVTFFCATLTSFDIITQKEEVEEAYWADFGEAYLSLTHDSDKTVIESCDMYLKEKLGL